MRAARTGCTAAVLSKLRRAGCALTSHLPARGGVRVSTWITVTAQLQEASGYDDAST